MTNKIWGFDLDEVLCDFANPLLELVNQALGLSLVMEDLHDYYIYQVLGMTEEEFKPYLDIVSSESQILYRSAILDGLTLFDTVKKLGNTVLIITSRTTDLAEATKTWLLKHEVKYDDIFFTFDKPEVAKKLKLNYYVEDNPKYITPIAEQGVTVFVPDYPWNRNKLKHKNIIPVPNCSAVLKHVI